MTSDSTTRLQLAALSAYDCVSAYRDRKVSPVEVATAVLAQIEEHNPRVNAYCHLDPETTLMQARASEARWQRNQPQGQLDGVPVAIKDVFLTRGWPTLRGSHTVDPNQPWTDDAPSTRLLRDSGAVFLGKTTTPEIGWKAVTDSSLQGITRNPWDLTRTAGGSSGGSAAAVALGMATLALGTDGGGSIRIPAAFTGTVGFKPTFGRVPIWPSSPFGTLAHAGPMSRTVADAALMLDVIAHYDPLDWLSLPSDPAGYSGAMGGGIRGLKVAYCATLAGVTVDPDVARAVDEAVHAFEDLGASVEPVDLEFGEALQAFTVLWHSGAFFATSSLDEARRAQMDPGLLEVLEEARGYSLTTYLRAAAARSRLAIRMEEFHERFDLLVTPSVPIAAFEAGREVPVAWPERRWPTWTPFSYPFNLTQQPALSVPCGFTSDGLPVGLQIVGGKYDDALVLRAGHAFETARPQRGAMS
jgi:aspartyl-tRNA(Asn)/glutamyl-tRNA(Gln) amidotransferase subunit A